MLQCRVCIRAAETRPSFCRRSWSCRSSRSALTAPTSALTSARKLVAPLHCLRLLQPKLARRQCANTIWSAAACLSLLPAVLLLTLAGHRLSAEHDNDPAALQEALLEEEKNTGPFNWIASRIPESVHNNKIWRTIFWVRSPCHLHDPGNKNNPLALVPSATFSPVLPRSAATCNCQ